LGRLDQEYGCRWYDTFIEIGPGKVLSGLVKRITKDVKVLNVEDQKSMNETLSAVWNLIQDQGAGMSLHGKIALVTGAAQGIGRDIAIALANDGADVAICDVNIEAAQKTAGDLEALGRKSLALKTNVAASAEVTSMMDQVVGKFGSNRYPRK